MGKFEKKYQELSDNRLLELYKSFDKLEPEAKKDIQEVVEQRKLNPDRDFDSMLKKLVKFLVIGILVCISGVIIFALLAIASWKQNGFNFN